MKSAASTRDLDTKKENLNRVTSLSGDIKCSEFCFQHLNGWRFFEKACHGLKFHFGVGSDIFYHQDFSPASGPLECTADHLSGCCAGGAEAGGAPQPGCGHQPFFSPAGLRGDCRCGQHKPRASLTLNITELKNPNLQRACTSRSSENMYIEPHIHLLKEVIFK